MIQDQLFLFTVHHVLQLAGYSPLHMFTYSLPKIYIKSRAVEV